MTEYRVIKKHNFYPNRKTEGNLFGLVVTKQATSFKSRRFLLERKPNRFPDIGECTACTAHVCSEMRGRFSRPLIKAAKWEITFNKVTCLLG